MKPRAIADELGRSDEPNVRMTLTALGRKGVAELVPGVSPQRRRLVEEFR